MTIYVSKIARVLAILLGLAAALNLFAPVHSALAFSVTPIVIEMTSAGRNSRASVRVINTSKKILPVEVSIKRFELDIDGIRKDFDGGDELLVFPPQAFIRPGATQNFRIQWVGEPLLKKSKHFMMSVTQLPVKLKGQKTAVQIVLRFGVMLNIAPPRGLSALSLVKHGIYKDKKGVRRPTITVKNSSNVHALLNQSEITVSGSGGWSEFLSSGTIRTKIGVGLVGAGKTRRFHLPIKIPSGIGRIVVSLKHKPKPPGTK